MDQFVIDELEAQLLKEGEAQSIVEEQLTTKRQALRVSVFFLIQLASLKSQ